MRPLANYPNPIGGGPVLSIAPHVGPTSYTQVTAGSTPAVATGGDVLQASEAGLKTLDVVLGGLSDSGLYRVETVPTAVSGVLASPNQVQTGTTTYTLRWTVVATGAQVAGAFDLDAEIVRLVCIGGY